MKKACSRLPFLCIAILAIVVAGCGGEKKTNEPPTELEDQLGFSETGIAERQSRVEGAIRDCMKAQGFEYVPVDPLAQQAALTGKARMSDEEFLKQFGYGISTLFGRGTEQSDPNDRLRKSLSAADRAAYDRALFGESPGLTFREAVDDDRATELGGCTKQATGSVFGGTAVLATVQGKFDQLEERITQDQRMVRAVEEWSACMADKGYQYEEPEEIDTDMIKRFQAIVGVGVEAGATKPPDPGTSYDRRALADLQSKEVATANADLECEKSRITPVERVVRPQYESAFRKENSRLLARVRPVGQ
jgi:hypothetical protein